MCFQVCSLFVTTSAASLIELYFFQGAVLSEIIVSWLDASYCKLPVLAHFFQAVQTGLKWCTKSNFSR